MLTAMGHINFAGVALGFALVVALAGCSAPGATATPTPTTQALGKVSAIDEVRDAFIEAGGVCNWEQTDQVTAATASGECSSKTVIMLFDDRAERETVVTNLQTLKMTDSDLTLLVGENWVINSPDAEAMQDELGGEWVTE
jgi:hypothetical protein